ncbi:hypothetical protein THIOM_003138 [Candidatus Thiomargarita nelsonii]|uniref:Uncharacterized protein n=1 Tax=Candidatus Thiomargarita nelsonii TaxID=1003181 RepID=A0A176RZK8_9GAMM|nr:hypothetical protein THIOM_003138 [Candidatus Thiomargarita nelsonii]
MKSLYLLRRRLDYFLNFYRLFCKLSHIIKEFIKLAQTQNDSPLIAIFLCNILYFNRF